MQDRSAHTLILVHSLALLVLITKRKMGRALQLAALALLLCLVKGHQTASRSLSTRLHHRKSICVPSTARVCMQLRGGSWSASRTMVDDVAAPGTSSGGDAAAVATPEPKAEETEPHSEVPPGYECKDGVCTLKSAVKADMQGADDHADVADKAAGAIAAATTAAAAAIQETAAAATATTTAAPASGADELSDELREMLKMGWEYDEAKSALAAHDNDVAAAAEALAQAEEDDLAKYTNEVKQVMEKGWDETTALSALRQTEFTVEHALTALQNEELAMNEQFESHVQDMVESGWDQDVATQALLMQWQKDVGKQGSNTHMKTLLQKTVDKVRGVTTGAAQTASKPAATKASKNKKSATATAASKSKVVPRESVVFDGTSANLQKTVVESPVPVLLQVTASWCGPCKQLTPILENMAIQTGSFRLVKLDSDAEKSIASMLQVKALPTVFAIRNGVIVDNFVGGMAQEDMQQFMMSFIMGTKPNEGAKLLEGQLSPIQRRALTLRLQQAAGLSELGMTRRQQIAGKIDNMLMLKNVLTSEQQQSVQAVTAVKQAMKLVSTLTSNAASGLGEGELTKYNKINQAGKLYQTVLLQQPVALQLLKIAGFREKDGDEGFLVLSHRNIAVLTLVRDKADNFVKNVKLPVTATDVDDVDTVNDETTAAKTAIAVHDMKQQQQHDVDSKQHSSSHIALMIDLTSDTSITIKDLSVDDTLDSVLKQINASSEVNSSVSGDDNTVIALAARFPKGVFDAAKDGAKTLSDLGIKTSTRLKAITAASSKQQQQHHTSKTHKATTTDSTDTTTATTGATVRKAPAVTVTVSTQPKKKTGTLFGKDGLIKAKKGPIEHIGGGGTTVTLATADTTADDDDAATTSSSSAPLKTQRKVKRKKSKKSSSSSSRHSSSTDKSAAEDL
eukprot:9888-Heterococcus_DN1.PRE.1